MSVRHGVCAAALLCALHAHAFAQEPAAGAAPVARPSIEYGVRFGPSFTSLTSVETFDADAAPAAAEPTMNFGGFFTIGSGRTLAIQPEILFAAKGHRIHAKDAPPIVTGTGTKPPAADRVVLIRYLEIPVLLRVANRTGEDSSVYLIGGPALALRRNAVIRQVADPGKLEKIGDLVTGSSLAFIVGGGYQHQRWLVDARLTRGMSNVAVTPEPFDVKTNAFSVLMGVKF